MKHQQVHLVMQAVRQEVNCIKRIPENCSLEPEARAMGCKGSSHLGLGCLLPMWWTISGHAEFLFVAALGLAILHILWWLRNAWAWFCRRQISSPAVDCLRQHLTIVTTGHSWWFSRCPRKSTKGKGHIWRENYQAWATWLTDASISVSSKLQDAFKQYSMEFMPLLGAQDLCIRHMVCLLSRKALVSSVQNYRPGVNMDASWDLGAYLQLGQCGQPEASCLAKTPTVVQKILQQKTSSIRQCHAWQGQSRLSSAVHRWLSAC